MKNIALIILFTLFMVGCSDDFLIRDHPTGITDDDFWKTTADASNALTACYNGLPRGAYHYTLPYVSNVAFEGMTDNLYHAGNYLGDVTTIGSGSNTPSTNHPFVVWREYYKYIRICSRFLENIDKPYFTDETERQKMIAEAHILRAYYHMLLLFYYGAEGIPIVDHALLPEEIFASKNTPDEVVDFIISELDIAIKNPNLPNKWTEDRGMRMSKAAAYSLKAIVALQAKRYNVAKVAAKAVIDMNAFELFYTADPKGNNFRDLFRYVGQVNNERIAYVPRGHSESWFRSMPKSMAGGQAAQNPTASIVNAFETLEGKTIDEYGAEKEEFIKNPLYKPRDPRLTTSIWLPGQVFLDHTLTPFNGDSEDAFSKGGASKTGFCLIKFIDPLDVSRTYQGNLDYMLIRYAEVLLVYVEALVESGEHNNPDVVKYLNQIRARAGMPNVNVSVYNSQEKLRELVRRERRVELAFEGQRYFDLRRWGIAKQQMEGPLYGAYNPGSGQQIIVETRVFVEPKNNYLPIPQQEIDANENITQNQGW
jgi:hypothetical protein